MAAVSTAMGPSIHRAVLVLVLVALTAGCGRDQKRLQDLFESATNDTRLGELDRARTTVASGLSLAATQADASWPWKFRLLDVEIRLISREMAKPFPELDERVPDGDVFAWVRARQRYLQGQHAIVRGKLADGVAALADASARSAADSLRDIRLDAEILQGVALLRLGKTNDGDAKLAAAADAARQSKDRFREATAVMNRGAGLLVRDRYDEALPYFEHVIEMNDLSALMVYALALRNAGVCYARLGDFDRALTVQRRSVEVNERRGPPIYLEQALGVLGVTHTLRGAYHDAISDLRRAFDIASRAMLYEDAARWADNLTTAYAAIGQWDDAAKMNTEAAGLNERAGTRTFIYNTFHRAEIANGRGDRSQATQLYESLVKDPATPPALAWEVRTALGGLSLDAGRLEPASRHFSEALDIIERTQSGLLSTDYKLSFLTRLIRFYEAYVDVLVEQGNHEGALAVADSSRARALAERQGVSAPARPSPALFRQIAANLKSVLLFYWIGAERSYAWVITADRIHLVPLSVSEHDVDQLVRDYRDMVVTRVDDPLARSRVAGDQLYDTLVRPVAAWIPAGSRVVVVPDGSLNRLNFETLPVPGNQRHYWIEDVEIAVAPSLGVLSEMTSPSRSGDRSVLLIGDAVPADNKYPSLRYASAEMNAIAGAFSRASVYRADRATPASYLESQPGRFDIVHFTAHADANIESPLDSAVILSKGATGFKLYARDVADHRLTADLVTISACRSAGERTYAGEGLVGFAWAFLRAGAKRVIAGLWDVDDRSTADLMGHVYGEIAAGHTPGAALRTAKLNMIKAGGAAAKPYYWAPFQVFIGSRVIP